MKAKIKVVSKNTEYTKTDPQEMQMSDDIIPSYKIVTEMAFLLIPHYHNILAP